ncbi:MAG: Fic family protein [Melioribacteraceae bacterium]|nr:Fic family protein [Melioribacteraceae bacterium]
MKNKFYPELPHNNLPILPPTFNFDDVEILKKVNTANIALTRLSGEAKSIPNRHLLIEPLSFREAVASSEIENIHTTFNEAIQVTYLEESELKIEQKETKNYREALLKGYNLVTAKEFLNTNSFITIQSILEPSKPGIRKISGIKIQNKNSGKIVYTPPEGEDLIRKLLKNYEDYFNDSSDKIDPLIKMAVLHYQFEAIHPFLDGNGRTGRILMVLYLCMVKRLELPILFLSGYINQNKNEYYNLLRGVTQKDNWKEWIIYILNAVESQSINTTKSVISIRELMQKYRLEIKDKTKIYSADLIEYLFSSPFYNQKTLQTSLGISRNTTSKYFSELERLYLIQSYKYKNDKIYYSPEFQSLLK